MVFRTATVYQIFAALAEPTLEPITYDLKTWSVRLRRKDYKQIKQHTKLLKRFCQIAESTTTQSQ